MKSSFSNNDCVNVDREVFTDGAEIFVVSDTKDPDGDVLSFSRSEWDAFIKAVKAGEFDFK